MNRLELVRQLRQFAGVGAGSTGNGPTTTLNQTGEYKRLVDWIDGAWNEIQQGHRWDFLWESSTVTIVAATNVTAGSIPERRYVQDAAYIGTKPLTGMPWAQFRTRYPSGLIAAGEPSAWAIRPDKAFVVNAQPTADTAIAVERYKNPIAMAADADTPAMPSEHHMAIVYKALLLYANFEEAGVTRATAQAEYDRHMMALGLTELPEWTFGAPLA